MRVTEKRLAERKSMRQKLRRAALWIFGFTVIAALAAAADGWKAFGKAASGERLARMERSPQWKDGHFVNPQPLVNDYVRMFTGLLDASRHTSPDAPLPTVAVDPARFQTPPPTGLRVTWLGHAALLVEIDGARVLTDPVWSPRASPFGWVGPQRWYTPPIALGELPRLDAVVISHDHYDHLDHRTIAEMSDWDTTFVVPLGIGAHLEYWGVPLERIRELDWWERTKVGELEIVCTPARHATGRHLFDADAKLWASYAFIGRKNRAYFSGDTGLFPAMREIGERLGPFDVTMIETGQYHSAWPDWHIGPEQAITAHRMLRGKVMLPIHWGLFTLAYHGWTEPAERVSVAADSATVTLLLPKPGQSVEPSAPPVRERWWPDLPWATAAQHPIVSTKVD